jgi:DNA (cytosine-5)-methyltransferase 1
MSALLASLRELGYKVRVGVFDAAAFNVPQRRRRVIVLGSKYGEVDFPRPARTSPNVRDAIGKLRPHGRSRDPLHDLRESRSDHVRELIRSIPRNGGSRADAGDEYVLDCHLTFDGFHDVYGRMAWDAVAPTITGGCVNPSKGRFLHPEKHRCITLREAALLQTFPRRYKFALRKGKFAVAEMIGNALPPEFVRRHAVAVRRHLVEGRRC